MIHIEAILVPLDGSAFAARSLGVASWLATRLGARLHVLSADDTSASEDDALERLHVPEKFRRQVTLHRVHGEPAAAILAAIEHSKEHSKAGLLVMAGQGETGPSAAGDPTRIVGHVTREVIERSDIPVLVLPPAYEESLPWRSILVALSGEITNDEALTPVLRLAHALHLGVSVAHVVAAGAKTGGEPDRMYADANHHELAERLNEMVARVCPLCSAEERGHIEDFRLAHGDVARELVQLIDQKQASVLAVGWRGRFMEGHAEVLKALIQQVHCPVLLVRPARKAPFRLKIGDALE